MLKPVALVTCKQGSEEWCIEEVGNVLFPYDFDIDVHRTRYPGLLIVYSKLDATRVYEILRNGEYGFVRNIIPIHIYTNLDDEELLNKIVSIVEESVKVKVKLRVRGVRGLTINLWRSILGALKAKNVIHRPDSSVCLYVEVIEKNVYVGKGIC